MKIKIEVEEKYLHRFYAMLKCTDALAAEGIELGVDVENPDILFIQEGKVRHATALKANSRQPLIIYERIGCAPVNTNADARRMMAQDNVLAWTKETNFRDLQLNNEPMIDGRYHLRLINHGEHRWNTKPQSQILTAETLDKIAAIFPIHMQERYDYLKSLRSKTIRKRPIDVFYAGTMHYTNKLVDRHRSQLVSRLGKIQNRSVLIGLGNLFSRNDFHDTLVQSKIFVSPYGSGAYSWKDFEALFAGCILIKPKSDFVTQYGFDIYKAGEYCVECDPEWSDLEEVIEYSLTNLDAASEFAFEAQKDIMTACNFEKYSADLVRFFKQF